MYKIFIVSLAVVFLNACARCKSFDEKLIDDTIEDYFGMYTKGSYWIYENGDKSKRDSVYVTEYSNTILRDQISCIKEERTIFKLKSNEKSLIPFDSSILEARHDYIRIGSDALNSTFLTYDNGVDLIRISRSDSLYDYGYYTKRFKNIQLNNKNYSGNIQVLYEDHSDHFENSTKQLYLNDGVGIIGWTVNKETFNLIKYNLQQ